ncbi:MAG: hypothetical protein WC666_03940 [Candidatus Paceibacterota bacterium]|jgi:hypothetical protein
MKKENEIISKKYFKLELQKALDEQKSAILRETRIMIFESLETIKVYFEEQGKRHLTALSQGFRDELLVYKDEVMTHKEKLDNYGRRILALEER